MISTLLIIANMMLGTMQPNQEEALANAVEQLRSNMVEPNEAILSELASPSLSYGHSNGVIEDKEEFVTSLVSGKYNFLSIQLTNQTIAIQGDIGIVRHDLDADTHDMGKPENTVKLHILTVWQKKEERWVLVARQAVKR